MGKDNEVKEKVTREPLKETTIKRSYIPLYTNLSVVLVLLLFLYLLLVAVILFLSQYIDSLTLPINIIASVIFIGVYLIYFVFTYLNYISTSYSIIPGSIQKTTMNTIDEIPGKVLVKLGFFYRNKILLTMTDFDNLRIEKSFMGRVFNFGNIHVLEKDQLDMTENYVLTNVIEPEEVAKMIQKMIDVERFSPQTAKSSTGDSKD